MIYLRGNWLEEQTAREIVIISNSGQRNARNLRCLVGHASEIPQFDQFGLKGILDAEASITLCTASSSSSGLEQPTQIPRIPRARSALRAAQFVCTEHDLSGCGASPRP